jgi:hypothetical protein
MLGWKAVMGATDRGPEKSRPDLLRTAFLIWCVVALGGAFAAAPPSAEYGALNAGALIFYVASVDGIASVVLVLTRLKDWRAWASLAVSGLTVAVCVLRTAPHGGP